MPVKAHFPPEFEAILTEEQKQALIDETLMKIELGIAVMDGGDPEATWSALVNLMSRLTWNSSGTDVEKRADIVSRTTEAINDTLNSWHLQSSEPAGSA